MTRGGLERALGITAIVGGALLSGGAIPIEAGGCTGTKPPVTIPLKETPRYKIMRASICGEDDPVPFVRDPYGSNKVIIESRTRFLGIPFLWRTNTGTIEGLSELQEKCKLYPNEGIKYIPNQVQMDVYLAEPVDCKI